MSIVEKAAERLRALQPEQPATPRDETALPHSDTAPSSQPASTIERLQERTRETGPVSSQGASPWHVDLMALERRGLIPADNDASARLADELRRIKRPLLGNAIGRGAKQLAHPQRIVVTSASPGEGKSFTTVNLAMSLAREPDFEVLLVDGDVPKFDVTRALGLEGQPGLMDVLTDERREPSGVIVRTDIPDLLVVPAGEPHPLTAELFGSLRMQQVLEAFGGRNRRRLVLFDSSPLLATSESQVLASWMGQVVVVVAAGHTPRHELGAALENLSDSQYVGLILNKSRLPASENHYDSYYGYGQYPRKGEA